MTLDFEYTGTSTAIRAAASRAAPSINRSDYGTTFNARLETGGVIVSEKIALEFEISAVKVVAAGA